MLATKNNAEWVSELFEQGVGESGWIEYQTEMKFKGQPQYIGTLTNTSFDSSSYTSTALIGVSPQVIVAENLSTIPSYSWEVDTAVYQKNFSVSAQDTSPYGLAFSADGTKMYVVGNTNDRVYQYTLSTPWDIGTAVYLKFFSVSAQEISPYSLAFSPDGSKMYVVGAGNIRVNQYTLSTPWDIGTAVYLKNFSVSAQDSNPYSLAFSADGSRMYVVGEANDRVYQYTLSTPWDIGTAVYQKFFGVSSQDTTPVGLAFSPDGSRMYVVGSTHDRVNQYTLSTPWDVGTAVFLKIFYVGTQDTSPYGLAFSPDGSRMYVTGISNVRVYQYSYPSTSTWADDIDTAVYQKNFSVSAQDTTPTGISFSSDGSKMYVVGTGNDRVFQYTLSTPWEVDTAVFEKFFGVGTQDTSPYGLAFSADGSRMYVVGDASDRVYQYTLSTPWDIGTAVYQKFFGVGTQDPTSVGLAFSADGSKMYFVGYAYARVHQYTLSTPWDIGTAVYQKEFGVSAQDGAPTSLAFSPDGSKMYVVGTANDRVYQYTLGTPWDIGTAVFQKFFGVSAQDVSPYGLAFSADGSRMYVVGAANYRVYQYSAPQSFTGYYKHDISHLNLVNPPVGVYKMPTVVQSALLSSSKELTNMMDTFVSNLYVSAAGQATLNFNNDQEVGLNLYDYVVAATPIIPDVALFSYNKNFSVGTQDSTPYGISFSPDGSKMYVVGRSSDRVFQYTLSTPWDIGTAVYQKNFSVGTQDTNPIGLAFSTDGTKMYVVGATNYRVNQYTLGTPWDVGTAVYEKFFGVSAQDTSPYGLAFSADGSKMYVLGDTNNSVNQYTLSTPWDIGTAVYQKFFGVSAQDTSPYGLAFSADGTKMYVVGSTTDWVYQYTLSTPWDVGTAVYLKNFYVGTQDSFPTGLAFSPDGSRMYVVGGANYQVYQYNTSQTLETQNLQIGGISVSGSTTTLSFTTPTALVASIKIEGRSFSPPTAQYTIDAPTGIITAKSDRVALPNGKRYAKIKVVGNVADEVTNVKLNLWTS